MIYLISIFVYNYVKFREGRNYKKPDNLYYD